MSNEHASDQGNTLPNKRSDTDLPPAGPHAKPELIDKEKTPGSGMMQDEGGEGEGNDAPSG